MRVFSVPLILGVALASVGCWPKQKASAKKSKPKMTPKEWTKIVNIKSQRLKLVKVVVAGDKFPVGHKIFRKDLALAQFPEKFRAPDYVKPAEISTAVGRVVAYPLRKGDVLSWHHLQDLPPPVQRRRRPAVSASIPPGGRAVTLALPKQAGIGRVIRAGDHVDLIVVLREQRFPKRLVARPLLQNVRVLGPRRRRRAARDSVTVLVLPREAEMIALAQKVGEIFATLRQPGEGGEYTSAPISVADLLKGELAGKLRAEREEKLKPPAPPPPDVSTPKKKKKKRKKKRRKKKTGEPTGPAPAMTPSVPPR